MADALARLGAQVEESADGLAVTGPIPVHAAPVRLEDPADHRIVMALALLGTRLPGGVELCHPEAVAKSWPGFFDWVGRIGVVTRL
jgi:3-phosphoshikimate 1-carboxyvinyltransferase